MGFKYLGTPYTDKNAEIRSLRFKLARHYVASQVKKGIVIFSPIVHCHEMAVYYNLPGDFDFWLNYDLAMLERADELWVLKLRGWNKSKGLKAEMDYANLHGIPIAMIESDVANAEL